MVFGFFSSVWCWSRSDCQLNPSLPVFMEAEEAAGSTGVVASAVRTPAAAMAAGMVAAATVVAATVAGMVAATVAGMVAATVVTTAVGAAATAATMVAGVEAGDTPIGAADGGGVSVSISDGLPGDPTDTP